MSRFAQSEMSEWEFVSEIAKRADCWLLFDVNNVYVSAFNHGFSTDEFLHGVPRDRVVQFHVAGHGHEGATSSTRTTIRSAPRSGTSIARRSPISARSRP